MKRQMSTSDNLFLDVCEPEIAANGNLNKGIVINDIHHKGREQLSSFLTEINDISVNTSDEIEKLLHIEIKKSKKLSNLIIYIFVDILGTDLNEAFISENEPLNIRKLAKLFSNEIKDTPIYIVIRNKKLQSTSEKFQSHLLYQKENVIITLNTNTWYITQQLTQNDQLSDKSSQSDTVISLSQNTDRLQAQQQLNTGKLLEEYELKPSSENICLILNLNLENVDYLVKCEENLEDAKLLERAFQSLGFHVHQSEFDELINFVTRTDVSSSACFVLCIITHYENGYFVKDSKKRFKLKKLFKLFNPSFAKIPKILLIHDPYKNIRTDTEIESPEPWSFFSEIPKHFLIIYSSFANGNVPVNYDYEGSVFIRSLYSVFKEFSQNLDILRMIQISLKQIREQKSQNSISNSNVPCVFVQSTFERLLFIQNLRQSTTYLPTEKFENLTFKNRNSTAISNNKDDLFYPFSRGKCILLSYHNENNVADKASNSDIFLLRDNFERLNFSVDAMVDDQIWKWQDKTDDEAYDCLVVFIFPNGNRNAITDREELLKYFRSKYLSDKPILFFVLGKNMISTNEYEFVCASCVRRIPKKSKGINIFQYENCLYFYSSEVKQVVQILSSELHKISPNYHLTTMLSNVINQTRQKNEEVISYFQSTLVRLVHFKTIQNDENSKVTCDPIQNDKRTMCLIVNFDGNEMCILEDTFEKLNCNVKTYQNLKVRQSLDLMEKIYSSDYSSYSSFVLCYSSCPKYILEDDIHCKNPPIDIDELIRCVSLNITLEGKPKIFIFDICNPECTKKVCSHNIELDSLARMCNSRSWRYPDLFVFINSYPGYVSYREREASSCFVKELCHALQKYHNLYDLQTIASMVCRNIASHEKYLIRINETRTKIYKQVPCFYSTLTHGIKLDNRFIED